MRQERNNGQMIRKKPIVTMGSGIRKPEQSSSKKRKKPIVTMGSGIRQ